MCNQKNGYRRLGSLHTLYQQEPTEADGRYVQVRQWLTADGEHSDLVVERGSVEHGELVTRSTVVPFYASTAEALKLAGDTSSNQGRTAH